MRDGTRVRFRPIRPDDAGRMAEFHEGLSETSVYYRFFHCLSLRRRIEPERLQKRCCVDHVNEEALVAVCGDAAAGEEKIIGVGRLVRAPGRKGVEFAVLVSDAVQGQGLGRQIMQRLICIARLEGYERIVGEILPGNGAMLRLCERLGFQRRYVADDGVFRVSLELAGEGAKVPASPSCPAQVIACPRLAAGESAR